jgi:hypothetical protein
LGEFQQTESRKNLTNLPLLFFFVQLIILCNVEEKKEVRDAKAMRPMTMLKHDKGEIKDNAKK